MVLGFVEVMERGAGGDDAVGKVFNTETFEGVGIEMFGEQRDGVVGGENPVVEGGEQDFFAEMLAEILHFVFLDNHFCGFEVL